MAIKIFDNIEKCTTLERGIASLVDCFFAFQNVSKWQTRQKRSLKMCNCDIANKVSEKVRTIGKLLKVGVESGKLSDQELGNVKHGLEDVRKNITKIISLKMVFNLEPSTEALEMSTSGNVCNVIFEATESIVKFTKELLCPAACQSGRCRILSDGISSQKTWHLELPVVFKIKASKRSSTEDATNFEKRRRRNFSEIKRDANEGTCSTGKKHVANDMVVGERRPYTESRTTSVLHILDKKRKAVNPNGLHQFVLWREAFKGAKERQKARKQEKSMKQQKNSLGARIGSFTKLGTFTCKIGIPFYSDLEFFD